MGNVCKCIDWFLVACVAAEALEHNAHVSRIAKALHENLKEVLSGEELEDLEWKHSLLQGYVTEPMAEMALAGSLGSIRDKCNADISQVDKLAKAGYEAIKRRDPVMAAEHFSNVKVQLLNLAQGLCITTENKPKWVGSKKEE